jgi:hypothetical protein
VQTRPAARSVELHHIGTEVGQQHPGDRAGNPERQVEDPYSVKRPT